MREETKNLGRRVVRPLVVLLKRLGVGPSAVTVAAIPLSIGAGILFGLGRFFWAGVVVLIAGLCDMLDGELSRLTSRSSPQGAFLDSVVDRLTEAAMLIGVVWFYGPRNQLFALLAVLALVTSYMVSYVRARAEGIGQECRIGFFERPVRVVLLAFGAIFLGRSYLPVVLFILTMGSLGTALRRFIHVRAGQRSG